MNGIHFKLSFENPEEDSRNTEEQTVDIVIHTESYDNWKVSARHSTVARSKS